mmetsp:Transcript_50083/g.150753  ORF Transcript_50083/g.150753 Transcript_50083/m.150753 type:complete len:211 (+) Transcript_50083:1526-2158(+)
MKDIFVSIWHGRTALVADLKKISNANINEFVQKITANVPAFIRIEEGHRQHGRVCCVRSLQYSHVASQRLPYYRGVARGQDKGVLVLPKRPLCNQVRLPLNEARTFYCIALVQIETSHDREKAPRVGRGTLGLAPKASITGLLASEVQRQVNIELVRCDYLNRPGIREDLYVVAELAKQLPHCMAAETFSRPLPTRPNLVGRRRLLDGKV